MARTMLRTAAAPAIFSLMLAVGGCCFSSAGSKTSGDVAQTPPEAPKAFEDGWPAMPEPGPAPSFTVPSADKFTLANGVPVTLVNSAKVPLVGLRINFFTGSSADPAGKESLTSFTADMLNEGTTTRSSLELSDALQDLATSAGFGSSLDNSYAVIDSLEENLDASLAIVAEMLLSPTIPEADVERVRGDRRNQLIARKDRLPTVGNQVFQKVLFGDEYDGRATTVASLDAITRDDLAAWHKRVFRPDNASIVVVGNLDAPYLQKLLNKHLGGWAVDEAAEPIPVVSDPAYSRHEGRTVYWVDRPGASQCYVRMGNVAPAFDEALQMSRYLGNRPLGGNFTARLNMNLREDKGFTYGARTSVSGEKRSGAFSAAASIKAADTPAALNEFFAELEGYVGERPPTADEFAKAVSGTLQGYPSRFEGHSQVLAQFGTADAQGRSDGWLAAYADRVNAVTLEAAHAQMKEILQPEHLAIVIVGDYAEIGPGVEALNIGPVVMLDDEGNPVPSEGDTQ